MTHARQTMTADEFDRRVAEMPCDYEYIAGDILAVVSNNYCSQIAMLIGVFITLFTKQNDLGCVTGADGGYVVNGERYMPDVGFIIHRPGQGAKIVTHDGTLTTDLLPRFELAVKDIFPKEKE